MTLVLANTRESIPYHKCLRPYTKSLVGCVLMQQLDYWFNKYMDGFYKFLMPCPNNPAYNEGASWQEELGVSPDEFRSAFDHIGTRYSSKSEYNASADKFQGKYYCSYFDKQQGKTHYFRNHALADAACFAAITGVKYEDFIPPVNGYSNLPEMDIPIPVDGESQSLEMGNPNPPRVGASTRARLSETTQEITQTQGVPAVRGDCFPSEQSEPEGAAELTPLLPEPKPKSLGRAPAPSQAKWRPDEFNALLASYPKSDERKAAITAWDRLRPNDEFIQVLMAAVSRFAAHHRQAGTEKRYICALAVFLNGEKWLNDICLPPAAPPPAPAQSAPSIRRQPTADELRAEHASLRAFREEKARTAPARHTFWNPVPFPSSDTQKGLSL